MRNDQDESRVDKDGRIVDEPLAGEVPTSADPRPFVGRSQGTISMTAEDLVAPIGEDWEVDGDL